MLKWQHIEYLFGLAALPLLVLLFYTLISWKKKTKLRIGDPMLVGQLVKNFSPVRFGIKATLALLALAAVVMGAANFQRPGAMQNIKRQGVDVMLVLDVSKSMLAKDIKPSRLEKAKQLLIRLNDKLESDRIGLVLFAGRAYLQMPLTTDHGAARMYIQDASPDVVPTQGTVIGEALKMANTSFNSKERKYKAILLVSDGEDHDPEAMTVAKTLAANGVMINAVGIGSPEGSPIVDPTTGELKKDEQGNTVISKLNEPELQQLADATHGHYIRLDNVDDALITESQQLEGVEKKALSDSEFIDYRSYFQWFLGIALVLLLVEYFLSERRRQLRVAAITGVLLMGASLTSSAQTQNGDAQVRSGNRYYKKKQLDQSQQQYEEAVRKAPENPTANYNLGNAQFRKNNYADAANSYNNSVEHSGDDKAMQEKGLYNKGVALIKQQKLQESIEAWKKALRLNVNDEDARENLQKALMQLKQQQQQQQEKKKEQDKKDKKEEKKDQQQDQPQQPKPQPSRLNKQQVEQYLKTLQQKEKEIQDKMNQSKVKAPNQPDKDW